MSAERAGKDGKNEVRVLAMAESADSEEMDFKAHQTVKVEFVPSQGLTGADATALLQTWGRNELEEKSDPSWLVFLRGLYQPMPIMIWIAIIVEAGIQMWADMGILLAIQFINATISWYETMKAGNAVAALKASLKPTATVKREGKWENIDAALVVPGDLVLLASGSAVPADCLINAGQIEVDQSALTGESLPVTMYQGDSAKMGSTVVRGEVEATVEHTGKHTFFGKTASMLQQGHEIGHLQKILIRIILVLVAISFLLCFTAFGYLLGQGEPFKEALQFTVVLLVASIPIAIEIVCTTTLALGSRQLSAQGAIVTRLAAIEDMAGMNMLCSDKTGTLTLNKMVIQEETPVFIPNLSQAELLKFAALATKWHEPPRDALDTLVLGAVDRARLGGHTQLDYMPFDPAVKRTEGTIRADSGEEFKVTKGAPHIILKLVDDKMVHAACDSKIVELGKRGIRSLAVAKTDAAGKWQLLGLLTFLDPPRPDTKVTIHRAMDFGVDVKMITGDHALIAKECARMLGLGTNIRDAAGLPSMDADGKVPKDLAKTYGDMILDADGFAQVYPEHKYLIVEALRQMGFAVGMTGDGVNDAPALKRADVGIAVQGATDAARAAADIVLTQPGLSTVVEAIVVARCIFQRMQNFINYRVAATLQLLTFFFIAVLALHPKDYWRPEVEAQTGEKEGDWPDFFYMPVIMLMLITLLNDGTLITIGYDNVNPSKYPEKWNLKALFTISTVLAGVACLSSLLLLWACLDSWNPDGLFAKWGIPGISYGKVITSVYLKVSVSDFLTLFSARTHEGFFWSSRPSPLLLGGGFIALTISTVLACVWPEGHTDKIPTEGLARNEYRLMPLWIWIYCIVWWFIQDSLKVLGYWVMYRFNIFHIQTQKFVNLREADSVNEPEHPLARHSVGLVQSKLLQLKVDDTTEKVQQLVKKSKEPMTAPNLQRASLDLQGISTRLQKVRAAVSLARNSLGQQPPSAAAAAASGSGALVSVSRAPSADVEVATIPSSVYADSVLQQVMDLERLASKLEPEIRSQIKADLEYVRSVAKRLKEARRNAAGDA